MAKKNSEKPFITPANAHTTIQDVPQFLPPEFVERLENIYSATLCQQIYQSFLTKQWCAFRLNPLQLNTHRDAKKILAELAPLNPQALANFKHTYVVALSQKTALTLSTAFQQGEIYIQNPSSMLAVQALNPQAGQEVLDLAAAPGGKTCLMAVSMQNQGRIAAVEPSRNRFFKLKANLEQQGVTIAQCYMHDGRVVGQKTPERFDAVLLDAPCSSDSVFNVFDPSSIAHWHLKKVKNCAKIQLALLNSAWQSLKPNGTLVYSTCAFSPEENEAVISAFLQQQPHAQLQEFNPPLCSLNHEDLSSYTVGLTHWQNKFFHPDCSKTLRVIPNGLLNGFYLAKICKTK